MHIEGVVTTGIYCRSDCSASPLPQNTLAFPTAVAAEAAGFRPCLRCRPWRLPFPAVDGAPESVASALVLIAEGYLDEHSIDDLACSVNFSSRQLRRDFLAVVGASPDAVARSRRAHFARRLLDETALPMTDVALASGFRSVRQFNRVMQSIFRGPPHELRERRRRTDLLATDGGIRLRVPYRDPLPFALFLRYLAPRAIPGVESVDGGVYRRTTLSCGCPGVIEVRDYGDGQHLEVTAHLPSFAALIDEVVRVRRLFGTDASTAASAELSADPFLGPLVEHSPALRLPGAWDRFETGIRVLLGQQVSVAAATTLAGRLVERFGERIEARLPAGLTHVFPSPARIADAEDLAEIGIPASRARTLREFARRFAHGELALEGAASLESMVATLRDIPGVGPWSAHLIAARVFGHPDAFPSGDLGLRRAAATLTGRQSPMSARELDALADRWRPHRATAAAFLWFASLETAGLSQHD